MKQRVNAQAEGVEDSYDEVKKSKKAKTARTGGLKKSLAAAKKKFAAKNKEVDIMIKVKDEEGKIVEFA